MADDNAVPRHDREKVLEHATRITEAFAGAGTQHHSSVEEVIKLYTKTFDIVYKKLRAED